MRIQMRSMVERLLGRNKYLSTFEDGFPNFKSASSACPGYNADVINEKSFEAARAVVKGEAAFERDGVLFTDPDPRTPVIEALRGAITAEGALRVLDIGGGLGSSYWQNAGALGVDRLSWSVLERLDLVTMATQLPPHPVTYLDDLDAALESEWDAVLLSSVLQYLPDPHSVLQQVDRSSCRTIIVDRTPIRDRAEDIVCVQHAPAHIYQASYPAWIFGRGTLEASLPSFSIIDRFPGIEPPMRTTSGINFRWEGFTATRGAG